MAQHRHETSWTERTDRTAADASPTDDIDRIVKRQGFQNSQTSLGIAGHWIGLAGTMAPIVIGEFITDPAKRWRATRLTAVGIAVAYEAAHTAREMARRKEQQAKLDECRSRAG